MKNDDSSLKKLSSFTYLELAKYDGLISYAKYNIPDLRKALTKVAVDKKGKK